MQVITCNICALMKSKMTVHKQQYIIKLAVKKKKKEEQKWENNP